MNHATRDDDSWELATQAALDIHRRAISAVRQRVTTQTDKVDRSAAALRQRQVGKARPVSAPPGRRKRRSRDSADYPTASNAASQAELVAWATLSHCSVQNAPASNTITRQPRLSKSAVTLDRAHPSHFVTGFQPKRTGWSQQQQQQQQQQVAAALPRTPVSSMGPASSKSIHLRQGLHGDASRQVQTLDQILGGHRTPIVESDALRRGGSERSRSDNSIRFLREHARKAMKEQQPFLRMLSAEAKAKDDSQIVMINRTTQRCHDLGKDVSYLPHRVGGKLHVLKVEHSFAAPRLDDTGGGVGGYRRDLEEHGKIITINSFVKGDYARLEKDFSAARCGTVSNRGGGASGSPNFKEPPNRMGEFSRRHVRTRPDAAETCQELHQLIRDTVRLVDVLTAQAVVLEGQGWNRSTGRNRTAQRPESK